MADPAVIVPGSGRLTPGVMRLLKAMDHPEDIEEQDGFEYDEYEAVCDRFEVWVGMERFHRSTINKALALCAISDVSDEGGLLRYAINGVGKLLLADPEQADELVRLFLEGKNITIRDGRIVELI